MSNEKYENFANELFEKIDEFHGTMDISEYKDIVLNLIFLRYLYDEFDKLNQKLIEEGEGFEEDKDEYISCGVPFIPNESRWNIISKNAHLPENGLIIDNSIKFIEDENSSLKGIMPKIFSKPELNKMHLGELIDLISNTKQDSPNDINFWSEIFEKCLYKFIEAEGTDAGDSYTPICIIKLIINILKPTYGRVYDPCCGTGGMFVQTKKFLEKKSIDMNNLSLYGQEINNTRWKLTKLHTIINKIDVDIGNYQGDTFSNDLHPRLKADFILANPKFNMENWGLQGLEDDARWKHGIPPENNANFAWIQHMIYHLSSNGKIGLVLPNGALSTSRTAEKSIKMSIIENDLVECVIYLPPQLFYSGGMSASIWFLNNNKTQNGKTLFIDAHEMGTMISRTLRELTDDDIKLIADTFDKFNENTLEDEKGFCKVCDLEEIKKQDYVLNPGRYVGFKLNEDDCAFEDKMKLLTIELERLMEESYKLDEKIRNDLKKLGFEI